MSRVIENAEDILIEGLDDWINATEIEKALDPIRLEFDPVYVKDPSTRRDDPSLWTRTTIDFETRSEIELTKVGAYNYAKHPSTEILCLGYKIHGFKPKLWKPSFNSFQDNIPPSLAIALWAWETQIEAFNFFFEKCIWHFIMHKQYGWRDLPLDRVRCVQAQSAALALPRKLEQTAFVAGISEQKDMAGHAVMMKLTKPRKPSKHDKSLFFHKPEDFLKNDIYCLQDCRTEHKLGTVLPPLSHAELDVWRHDLEINWRGIYCDVDTARNAVLMIERLMADANRRIVELTEGEVETVGQRDKIMDWANERGANLPNLQKETLEKKLEDSFDEIYQCEPEVAEVLQIRLDNGKASIKKFQALIDHVSDDGRIRDLLVYHGASTGRWTGQALQPHNMFSGIFKGKRMMSNIESVIRLVNEGDLDSLKMFYSPPMLALGSITRSMFCAAPGKILLAADYNAIETRVGAWFADEQKLVSAFERGESPYLQLAEILYKRPISKFDDPKEYKVGKSGILGSQYQCGPDRFSEQFDTPYKLAKKVVKTYRDTYTKIVEAWADCEEAALHAVSNKTRVSCLDGKITFSREKGWLFCELPSGRRIGYFKPRIQERIMYVYEVVVDGETRDRISKTRWKGKKPKSVIKKAGLTYEGLDDKKKWRRLDTYGGKLFENIVQATSRDIMARAIPALEFSGFPVVLTVHDEIVCEVDPEKSLEQMVEIMIRRAPWALDLPIGASGWRGRRYRKD
jgi:DNA polymerase bacteriophage-type